MRAPGRQTRFPTTKPSNRSPAGPPHEPCDHRQSRSADRALLLDHEPRRQRSRLPQRAPAQPAGAGLARDGADHGRRRARAHGAAHLFQSAAHARLAAAQCRQPGRVGHQDHHGEAAAVGLHARFARLRAVRRGGQAGPDQAGFCRAAKSACQAADAGQIDDADVRGQGPVRRQDRDTEAR